MAAENTVREAQMAFAKVNTRAPTCACSRLLLLEPVQCTMRRVTEGITVALARRKAKYRLDSYSTGMLRTEKKQESLLAFSRTFLETMEKKHAELTESHNELTCFTCQHRALMQTNDPVKIAEAEELQRGRDVATATYQAEKAARITAARNLARENWWLHMSMN